MTKAEAAHVSSIIKYNRKEIAYDEFAYKRMRAAYRGWLKNILKHGHPGFRSKPEGGRRE